MKVAQWFVIGLTVLSACSQAQKKESRKKAKNHIEHLSEQNLQKYQKAYFASGCFWCVEEIYESVKGVKEVVSGYAGGQADNPSYEAVGKGSTGHAEAVLVYYDSTEIDFKTLVKVYYGSQDPTTLGQQPDLGSQYRSIIFYSNDMEKKIAEKARTFMSKSEQYSKPVITEIEVFDKFYPAEDYHQNYVENNPSQRYVVGVSIPRYERFKAKFPELLKSGY